MTVKITVVSVLADFQLLLRLGDNATRRFDCRPYLTRGAFRRSSDVTLFRQAYVAFDTVCWQGQLDIAPETLLAKSEVVQGPAIDLVTPRNPLKQSGKWRGFRVKIPCRASRFARAGMQSHGMICSAGPIMAPFR